MIFNKRLKELREEMDILQKDIAKYIGVSERVYGYYEDNRFPKDPYVLGKLAEYFDVNLLYLMGLSDNKNINQDNSNKCCVFRFGGKEISADKVNKIIEFAILSGLIKEDE